VTYNNGNPSSEFNNAAEVIIQLIVYWLWSFKVYYDFEAAYLFI
jgi:hypothetical protein